MQVKYKHGPTPVWNVEKMLLKVFLYQLFLNCGFYADSVCNWHCVEFEQFGQNVEFAWSGFVKIWNLCGVEVARFFKM
jgi:hypothetical protein